MLARRMTKCIRRILRQEVAHMGKRPRPFYGVIASPVENCGCAVCTWSVGRGSWRREVKSPSLVDWLCSRCCHWSAHCRLLLIINPQDPDLLCWDLWLLWNPCLFSGPNQYFLTDCWVWSVTVKGEEASFIKFPLSPECLHLWWGSFPMSRSWRGHAGERQRVVRFSLGDVCAGSFPQAR